jgi:hypothetical protein
MQLNCKIKTHINKTTTTSVLIVDLSSSYMPLPEEYRRHSFLLLGAVSLLGGVTLLLLWSAWLLVRPHLMALMWATCAAAVMRSIKAPLTSALLHLNRAVPTRAKQAVRVVLFSLYMLALLHGHDAFWVQASLAERVVFITIALSVALVALLPWIVSTDTLATLSILAAVLAAIAFFSVFVVRVCYAESVIAVRLIRSFLDDYIDHVRAAVDAGGAADADYVWRNAAAACDRLPAHIPVLSHYWLTATPPAECHALLDSARAKAPQYAAHTAAWLASNVQWIGDKLIGGLKGILDVVGSVGDILFSGFIFVSALYYFVKNDRAIAAELRALSPLDAAENVQILSLLHEKVLKTFILSILLAISRFLIALGCFSYAGFEVIWVFSFASGFLAIVPILSSWLIWLPATIVLVARDGVWSTPWPSWSAHTSSPTASTISSTSWSASTRSAPKSSAWPLSWACTRLAPTACSLARSSRAHCSHSSTSTRSICPSTPSRPPPPPTRASTTSPCATASALSRTSLQRRSPTVCSRRPSRGAFARRGGAPAHALGAVSSLPPTTATTAIETPIVLVLVAVQEKQL